VSELSTTLAPGAGAGVLFTQAGTGATPGYSAIDLRRMLTGCLQEGVVEAGAYMVTARGAGDNMSVDIAADDGHAYVQGDSITAQGLYVVPPHSASINEAITAADSTNPRVDQVILEIRDNTHDASGGNEARVRVVAGTATSGATLANRTGAAVTPGNAILLADVLVPANDTSIANSQIRDRRPWARGAFVRVLRTENAGGTDDYTTTSTTPVAVDSANLKVRVECSGRPVRVAMLGQFSNSGASSTTLRLGVDGSTTISGDGDVTGLWVRQASPGANVVSPVVATWVLVPSGGSHTFEPYWDVGGSTGKIYANASPPLEFVVEEIARPSTANNTSTSG